MIGPKTDNAVTDGGHNSGTITIGLTFEQHQAALEKTVAQKAADLERAHIAVKNPDPDRTRRPARP